VKDTDSNEHIEEKKIKLLTKQKNASEIVLQNKLDKILKAQEHNMKVESRKLEQSASGDQNTVRKNRFEEKHNNASDLYWQQKVDRILKVQEHNRKVHSRKEILKETNENQVEQGIMLASYEQRMLKAQQRRQE